MKKLHYIVLLANFDPLTKEDLDFAMEKKKELDADGVYGGIKEFLKNEEGNK